MCVVSTLTRLALVLLLSSSGMGVNTAKATQFAKMVNRMMISKALDGGKGSGMVTRIHRQTITICLFEVAVRKQEPHPLISG